MTPEASASQGAVKNRIVRPTEFVTFLEERMEEQGRFPRNYRTDLVHGAGNHVLSELNIPGHRGDRGIAIERRFDPQAGIQYEVTDSDGDVYVVDSLSGAAERRAVMDKGQTYTHPITDFSDLQERIIELETPLQNPGRDPISQFQRMSRPRQVLAAATATVMVANAGIIAGELISKKVATSAQPPGISGPVVPGNEQDQVNQEQLDNEQWHLAVSQIRALGWDIGRVVLKELNNPDAGIKAYNERVLTGHNRQFAPENAPDDTLPQVVAGYIPDESALFFRSVMVQGEGDQAVGYRVEVSFRVLNEDNPIRNNPGQLTLDDIRQAFDDPETMFLGIDVGNGYGYDRTNNQSLGSEYGLYFGPFGIWEDNGGGADRLVPDGMAGDDNSHNASYGSRQIQTADGLKRAAELLAEGAADVSSNLNLIL